MNMANPRRLAAIQAHMLELQLDALLLRLGENMLPLTGYWPGLWLSAALVLPDGRAIIICPEMEAGPTGDAPSFGVGPHYGPVSAATLATTIRQKRRLRIDFI